MIVEQMLKNAQTPLLHIADVSGSALFQGANETRYYPESLANG